MSRRQRLRDDLREMGLAGWASYSLDRLLARLTGRRVRFWALQFYAQPVPKEPLLAPARASKLKVGLIEVGDVPSALFERPRGAVEKRFQDGSLCVAARSGEAVAGYMWLHFGRLKERMFICDFEAVPTTTACWDYDFEVLPPYRLGRTFVRLWDEAFRILRERGIETTVSWILLSNRASARAHERMGARPAGWLVLLTWAGYGLAVQPRAPFLRLARPGRRLHVQVDGAAALLRGEKPDA
jgi:hypothetical protein